MPSPRGTNARRALRNRLSPKFMEKMDKAFTDLRADYELGEDDVDPAKLRELHEMDVDTGMLDHLVATAQRSSGIVTGLRGTGKSHLFLLAQDHINKAEDGTTLAVYVNLKRLRTVSGSDVGMLERLFILLLASAIKRELSRMVNSTGNTPGLLKAVSNWVAKRQMEAKARAAEKAVKSLEAITKSGEAVLKELSQIEREMDVRTERGIINKSSQGGNAKARLPVLQVDFEAKSERQVEDRLSQALGAKEKFKEIRYLSVLEVRSLLVQVVSALGLRSIVFFFDEWSKLPARGQENLAALVDSLVDDPLFVWIAAVTHDYTLGTLEVSADLPHHITLDKQLIFERDRAKCKAFFADFVNKRLWLYTGLTDFTYSDFIRDNAFEPLVMASMGNARDFGIMLQQAWLLFKQEKTSGVKKVGGQAWYIGLNHIEPAIKQLGKSKLENLDKQGVTPYAKRLWNELKVHAQDKGHTHFCIPNTPKERECMDQEEMTYLLKHRSVLVREEELSLKTASVDSTSLTLCALDFSCLDFDRNSWLSTRRQPTATPSPTATNRRRQQNQFLFVVDWETIHNRVRRYTFPLHDVVSKFKVERGEQHICHHCGFALRPEMVRAWEDKYCPSCGNNPFQKPKARRRS